MYSYFIFLTTSDGEFFSMNICCGIPQEELSKNLLHLWKICDKRLMELRKPWRMGDMIKWRVVPDICDDPVDVDVDEAVRMQQRGAWKLSGEFPGRATLSITTTGVGPVGWPYGDEL